MIRRCRARRGTAGARGTPGIFVPISREHCRRHRVAAASYNTADFADEYAQPTSRLLAIAEAADISAGAMPPIRRFRCLNLPAIDFAISITAQQTIASVRAISMHGAPQRSPHTPQRKAGARSCATQQKGYFYEISRSASISTPAAPPRAIVVRSIAITASQVLDGTLAWLAFTRLCWDAILSTLGWFLEIHYTFSARAESSARGHDRARGFDWMTAHLLPMRPSIAASHAHQRQKPREVRATRRL